MSIRTRNGPKVLHVTTADISLGLLVLRHLTAFREAGYRVAGTSASGPFVERLADAGIPHIPLAHATRSIAPTEDVKFLAELVSVFRRVNPDIVHTHNPKSGALGRIAARIARVPLVINTVHGLYAQPTDRRARRIAVYGLERTAALFSDLEFVQSREDYATLRHLHVPARKLRLLGNGIDLSRFTVDHRHATWRQRVRDELGIDEHQIVVGAVGRLVNEKGYVELFGAAELLHRSHPQACIVIAGPTEEGKPDAVTEAAIRRARDVGVQFLGMRHDVERLYAAMDVYVLASHREGFPRSAMEASAMGLPIVATDIRGCREVVDDGRTGILVPPRDVGGLAEAIKRLVDNPELRAAFGAAARRKASVEFDDRQQIGIQLHEYRRLLRSRNLDLALPPTGSVPRQ